MKDLVFNILKEAKEQGVTLFLEGDKIKINLARDQPLDQELLAAFGKYREEIKEFLRQDTSNTVQGLTIQKQVNGEVFQSGAVPLSFEQEGIWLVDQIQGSVNYHMPIALKVKGELDHDVLQHAFQHVLQNQLVLRTVIREDDQGKAYQYLIESDWTLEQGGAIDDLDRYIAGYINKAFSLDKDFMIRASLVEYDSKQFLIIVIHHIAFDGWSQKLLMNDLSRYYQDILRNVKTASCDSSIQYGDYAIWQRDQLSGSIKEDKLHYWRDRLSDLSPLNLPTDYPRPSKQSSKGALAHFRLGDRQLLTALQEISRSSGATLFMTLLSGFKVLLYRHSGQDDVCVGSPVANRSVAEVEGLIGLFVNSLPVRTRIRNDFSFLELLESVRENTLKDFGHQDVPFEKIVQDTVGKLDLSRSPIFQVMFALQNNEKASTELDQNLLLEPYDLDQGVSKFDLTVNVSEDTNGLGLTVEYCTDLYARATIDRMAGHFESVLENIVSDPACLISELPILKETEVTQLIKDFNQTERVFEPGHVLDLFAEMVRQNPNKTALIFEDARLTYGELDRRSSKLARLLQEKSLGEESIVGLCLDKSFEMVIGILAILKAGGAYLPLSPAQPLTRLKLMLSDAKAKCILTFTSYLEKIQQALPGDAEILRLEKESIWSVDDSGFALPRPTKSSQLFNLIYTSGSTGLPKGVEVTHAAVANLIKSQAERFNIDSHEVILQFSDYTFDASVEQLFLGLCFGGTVFLPTQAHLLSDEFVEILEREAVSHIHATPGYLAEIKNAASIPSLKRVIAGGDVCSRDLADFWSARVSFYNEYGPTECTVTCIEYQYPTGDTIGLKPLIGKPISNTEVYVLDHHLNLVPIGFPGELYIGGAGLSRGYLNKPELTAKHFIEHLYRPGERLYRTGDIVRWHQSGDLEFLGREDAQIKLRGYRIELGEIEKALESLPTIQQAVVALKGVQEVQRQLVGYVVMGEEKAFDKEDVKEQMHGLLPAYMIPSALVALDAIPLTKTGKVDRKALPEISISQESYEEPATDMERILSEIWQGLLNVDRVSRNDNFFELGGDSIITIQVVSRAKRQEIHLQPRDLFEHQTLKALASHLESRESQVNLGEQGLLMGRLGLSPIQSHFLNDDPATYFNQSVMLDLNKEVSNSQLHEVVQALVSRHDILRVGFDQDESGHWRQTFESVHPTLQEVSLIHVEADLFSKSLTERCEKFQSGLTFDPGEMFRIVLIKTGDHSTNNRLLFVLHHLIVDGVSWRILLDDLSSCLSALQFGGAFDFGEKGSSYRQWVEAMERVASSKRLDGEFDYWKHIQTTGQRLRADHELDEKVKYGDLKHRQLSLSLKETETLLKEVHHAYGTEVEYILLSALWLSMRQCSGSVPTIGLEGHGREELPGENLDLSQTVGWFTSLYPVSFPDIDSDDPGIVIRTVKEELRQIPNKGIGYGMLRSYHPSEQVREVLSEDCWDVVFNYLGQTDHVIDENSLFRPSNDWMGESISNDLLVREKLSLNGSVSGGKLQMTLSFSPYEFDESNIDRFATAFTKNLQALIAHCKAVSIPKLVPSDYGLSRGVNISMLDKFLAERGENLETCYRLSPMQEGMLYHSKYSKEATAYMIQQVFELPNGLNKTAFIRSWEHLLRQYSILRTGFFVDGALSKPVQCVFRNVEVPWTELDFSDYSESDQVKQLADFLQEDLLRKFDYQKAPLIRLSLIDMGKESYKLIITQHHLLLDGWSTPVLFEELLNYYELELRGEGLQDLLPDNYGDYISEIYKRDVHETNEFWRDYLQGFTTPTMLPFISDHAQRNKGVGELQEHTLALGAELSAELRAYAKTHQLTLNTIFQGVWSYLLSCYTATDDVLYGVTVSGRSGKLANAERRVGLYINTIPLRAKITREQNVVDWLQKLQQDHSASRDFEHSALSTIQGLIGLGSDLFDSLLIFENYPTHPLEELAGYQALDVRFERSWEGTNYPLTILVLVREAINVKFSYNASLLDFSVMQRISEHVKTCLNALVCERTEALRLTDWNYLPSEELSLLYRFNETTQELPGNSIFHLLDQGSKGLENEIALVFGESKLTYETVNQLSCQLANWLIAAGVRQGDSVGVLLPRSEWSVLTMLGIWKMGGVYVPISDTYPRERQLYILKDSDCKVVLADEPFEVIEEAGLKFMDIKGGKSIADLDTITKKVEIDPNASSYIIYTSGSTGEPKGVVQTYLMLHNLINWDLERSGLLHGQKHLQYSSYSFDSSLHDALFTFTSGGQLHVLSDEIRFDLKAMASYILDHQIATISMPYAALRTLFDHMGDQLSEGHQIKAIISTGEQLQITNGLRRFLENNPAVRIHNFYGPSETHVVTGQYYQFSNDEVPSWALIGKPIDNTTALVLDNSKRPVAIGVAGELYLGGANLAVGYAGKEILTTERFVAHPYEASKKLYRTGDLVKWHENGSLEYIGREDGQIKIRGYRVELGEIEHALEQLEFVRQGAVLPRRDQDESVQLIGYVAMATDASFDPPALVNSLKAQLPEYMVPTIWHEMDVFPLNTNGKIDKRALPAIDVQQVDVYKAPESEIEVQMTALWAEVLGLTRDKVSIDTSFFQLGGHSLKALVLISKIEKVFEITVSIKTLFEFNTIQSFCEYLEIGPLKEHSDEGFESELFEL